MQFRQAEQQFFPIEEMIGRGEYDSAITLYEKEQWEYPGHPLIQERLLQLYIGSILPENWKKAYRLAEDLLQRNPRHITALNSLAQFTENNPTPQQTAQYYQQLGDLAFQQKEATEAALAYSRAADFLEQIDPNAALLLWRQANQADPTHRPAISAIARHALKSGHFRDAEAALLGLIAQTPPSVERARHQLSLAGLYRSRLRNLEESRKQLEQASAFLADDVAYLRELAEYSLAADENLEALRLLNQAIERIQHTQPNHSVHADLLYRSGQILEERLGRPGAALRRYRQVCQIRPDHLQAFNRARALEANQIQEEDFHTENDYTLELQIEEKKRQIAQGKALSPAERSKMLLELARLYWQRQEIDNTLYFANQAVLLDHSDENAWPFLEEIYIQTQRQQEIVRLLQQKAYQAPDDQSAMALLERALRLQPNDEALLPDIVGRYQRLQQWEKLDTLYQRWAESAPQQAPALALERAQLLEERLKKLPEAEIAYLQAYQLAPHDTTYLQALIRFYIRCEEWSKLERQIERFAQLLSPPEQAQLYLTQGQILRSTHQQTQRALEAYQKALSLQPQHTQALRACIDLLREQQRFQELLPLLSQLAEITDQKEEQLSIRLESASIHEEQLHEEQKAYEAYEKVLRIEPTHPVALKRLALLDERAKRWDAAVKHWEALYTSLPPKPIERIQSILEQIIALHARLQHQSQIWDYAQRLLAILPHYGTEIASTLALPLNDKPLGVIVHLAQQTPSAPLWIEAYHRLAKEEDHLAQICWERAYALEPFLASLWQERLTNASPEERAPLWLRLTDLLHKRTPSTEEMAQIQPLFEELQHLGMALAELRSLNEILKEKVALIPTLSRLYAAALEEAGEIEEALLARQHLRDALPVGTERAALTFELAIQKMHVLGDRDAGKEALWDTLAQDPTHTDAFSELQQAYEEEGDLHTFVKKLEEAATSAPPGQGRADLFLRTFELYRHLLADEDEARAMLQRAADQANQDSETLRALAISYEEMESLPEAASIYLQLADIAQDSEAIRSLERAAEIQHYQLESPDEAMLIYQRILEKDPTHERAVEALKEIYETLWMWDDLAQLLERLANQQTQPALRAQKLFELAELYLGRQADYDRALTTYRQALRYDPRNLQILQSLQALYEEREDWPAVVSALKARTRAEVDPAQLFDTFMRIADLSQNFIERPDEAEKYYRLAHTQLPARPEPLQALLSILEQRQQPIDAAQMAARIAILLCKQGQTSEARDSLQHLLAITQDHPESIHAEDTLRRLLLEQQESAELAKQLFDLLLGEAADLEDPLPLHARLYQQQLTELSWLIRFLDNAEEDLLPQDELESLRQYAREKEWLPLAKQLEKLSLQDDLPEDERASYALAAAEIQTNQLQKNKTAKELALRALSLGIFPERALPLLAKLLAPAKNKQPLSLDLLFPLLDQIPIPEDRPRAAFHLAGVFARQAQWSHALRCLIDALAAKNESREAIACNKNLQALELAISKGKTPGTELFSAIADRLPETYRLLLQAWLLFQSPQTNDAWTRLEAILDIDPQAIIPLRLLGQQAYNLQELDKAQDLLTPFLEQEWEALPFDEVVELCLILAQIAHSQQNWESALFYIDQAYKFIPEDARIFDLHTKLLQDADRPLALRDLFIQRIEMPEACDDLPTLWFQLGSLYLHHLNNFDEAQFCFQQTIHLYPLHEGALKALNQWTENPTASELSAISL
jgi:tetratricopeptide (TPR) repeat protein